MIAAVEEAMYILKFTPFSLRIERKEWWKVADSKKEEKGGKGKEGEKGEKKKKEVIADEDERWWN